MAETKASKNQSETKVAKKQSKTKTLKKQIEKNVFDTSGSQSKTYIKEYLKIYKEAKAARQALIKLGKITEDECGKFERELENIIDLRQNEIENNIDPKKKSNSNKAMNDFLKNMEVTEEKK